MPTEYGTLQLRQGTTAQMDPIVLEKGEPGLSIDGTTIVLKIGDGSRSWDALPEVGGAQTGGVDPAAFAQLVTQVAQIAHDFGIDQQNLQSALAQITENDERLNDLTDASPMAWDATTDFPRLAVVRHNGLTWYAANRDPDPGDEPGVSGKWQSLTLEHLYGMAKRGLDAAFLLDQIPDWAATGDPASQNSDAMLVAHDDKVWQADSTSTPAQRNGEEPGTNPSSSVWYEFDLVDIAQNLKWIGDSAYAAPSAQSKAAGLVPVADGQGGWRYETHAAEIDMQRPGVGLVPRPTPPEQIGETWQNVVATRVTTSLPAARVAPTIGPTTRRPIHTPGSPR